VLAGFKAHSGTFIANGVSMTTELLFTIWHAAAQLRFLQIKSIQREWCFGVVSSHDVGSLTGNVIVCAVLSTSAACTGPRHYPQANDG